MVKLQFKLKIPPNYCLIIKSLLNWVVIVLFSIVDIIRIISFPGFANDFNLTLYCTAEIDLVKLVNIPLIFRTRPIKKSGLGNFNAAFSIKREDKSLLVGNILTVTKNT